MEISRLKGTNCCSFDNSPTVLLIFKRIVSMWLLQESFKSRLILIVQVNVVLNRTVVVDSD